jgi:hypothetical protein
MLLPTSRYLYPAPSFRNAASSDNVIERKVSCGIGYIITAVLREECLTTLPATGEAGGSPHAEGISPLKKPAYGDSI